MKTETSIINGITINNVIYEESDFRSEIEKNEILKVCYACEKFDSNICSECGCIIAVLSGSKNNSCPLSKW